MNLLFKCYNVTKMLQNYNEIIDEEKSVDRHVEIFWDTVLVF